MEEKFIETIKKFNLINSGDSIVIGVSGGPDSICLLNLLAKLKTKLNIKLYVAHINHMIREEADEETVYVQNFCKDLKIECFVKKINVIEKAKHEKIGTEEAGRNARYEFFNEILETTCSNKIATAHNANDNAETVIMNIIRGTGTFGLKGIEPIRDDKFIRPIIECERNEIEEYCEIHKLHPKIDKTNYENVYTRNKIRNLLIPYIKEKFNPNIIGSINRLSELAESENNYLDKISGKEFDNCVVNELNDGKSVMLDLKKFNNNDDVIKSRIILMAIKKTLGNTQGIEKIHIEDIIKLCNNNIGNKYLKPNKNIKVLVKNGKIFFICEK